MTDKTQKQETYQMTNKSFLCNIKKGDYTGLNEINEIFTLQSIQ